MTSPAPWLSERPPPGEDRIDQVIARGKAAYPAADGSLGRQLTDALMWCRRTLSQADTDLALAMVALRRDCQCADEDKEPPTDWVSGTRIPHHVDCPLFPFERPDPEAAPAAAAEADHHYGLLKTIVAEQATQPEVPPT